MSCQRLSVRAKGACDCASSPQGPKNCTYSCVRRGVLGDGGGPHALLLFLSQLTAAEDNTIYTRECSCAAPP